MAQLKKKIAKNHRNFGTHKTVAKPAATPPKEVIGWREFVGLPGLGIGRIKAKIDSGARSCALHAVNIRYFQRQGAKWVAFAIHPRQRDSRQIVYCEAPLLEERSITDSGGKRTLRPVIVTAVQLGFIVVMTELTLVARDEMGFRMLIGRQTIRGRYLIDPGRSFVISAKESGPKGSKIKRVARGQKDKR